MEECQKPTEDCQRAASQRIEEESLVCLCLMLDFVGSARSCNVVFYYTHGQVLEAYFDNDTLLEFIATRVVEYRTLLLHFEPLYWPAERLDESPQFTWPI